VAQIDILVTVNPERNKLSATGCASAKLPKRIELSRILGQINHVPIRELKLEAAKRKTSNRMSRRGCHHPILKLAV